MQFPGRIVWGVAILAALAQSGTTLRAEGDLSTAKVPAFIHELRAGRVTDDAIRAHLAERARTVAQQCRADEFHLLSNDQAAFQAYLVEKSRKGDQTKHNYNLLQDMNADFGVAKFACSPWEISERIRYYGEECRMEEMRSELAKLAALEANYRGQAQALAAVEGFAAAERKTASVYAGSAKNWLARAQASHTKAVEICAGKKPVAPSGQMAGRWISRIHGGAIETSIGADGMLSARIVALNPVMQRNGYASGMEIMRGWGPRGPDSIWSDSVRDGEYFIARQPDRKPNEQYGTATWEKGGVVYMAIKNPGVLELPATLANRLSNYDPWIRDSR